MQDLVDHQFTPYILSAKNHTRVGAILIIFNHIPKPTEHAHIHSQAAAMLLAMFNRITILHIICMIVYVLRKATENEILYQIERVRVCVCVRSRAMGGGGRE